MCPMNLYMPTAFGQYIELYKFQETQTYLEMYSVLSIVLDIGDYRDEENALLAVNFSVHV